MQCNEFHRGIDIEQIDAVVIYFNRWFFASDKRCYDSIYGGNAFMCDETKENIIKKAEESKLPWVVIRYHRGNSYSIIEKSG